MEQERPSPNLNRKVWLGLAALFVVLFLLSLGAPRKRVAADFGLSFTPPRSGHMENFYSKHFLVAMVTNTTAGRVGLENPVVEWEEKGAVITTFAVLWGGTNGYCSFGSSEVMPLPFEIPVNSTKFRIRLEYWHDAGPFKKLLSPVLSKLFRRYNINHPLTLRVFTDGWQDGRLHFSYESGWETNR